MYVYIKTHFSGEKVFHWLILSVDYLKTNENNLYLPFKSSTNMTFGYNILDQQPCSKEIFESSTNMTFEDNILDQQSFSKEIFQTIFS